jgi:hypothetical protein
MLGDLGGLEEGDAVMGAMLGTLDGLAEGTVVSAIGGSRAAVNAWVAEAPNWPMGTPTPGGVMGIEIPSTYRL